MSSNSTVDRNQGTLHARKSVKVRKVLKTSDFDRRSGAPSSSNSYVLLLNFVWIAGLASLLSNQLNRSYISNLGTETGTAIISLTGSFLNCTTGDTKENAFENGFHDGSVTISCRTFHYKAPTSEIEALAGSNLIIGVVSGPDVSRRTAIRQTWKKLAPSSVFFVMTGQFATIQEEYELHNDILWLDMQGSFVDSDLTYKVQFLFQLIHKHVLDFKFILKTDVNCFVNITKFQENQDFYGSSNFWGNCKENVTSTFRPGDTDVEGQNHNLDVTITEYPAPYFPAYCDGTGYLLSRDFLSCAVQEIPHVNYFKFEDIATGMLAERCHMEPVNAGPDKVHIDQNWPFPKMHESTWIEHDLFSPQHMVLR